MSDLRTHLLRLVAPLSIGDEIVPGVRLAGASTELGMRLTFVEGGTTTHVEVTPADLDAPHAARTPRLLLAYRGNADDARAAALCREVAARCRANETEVLAALEADAARVATQVDGSARIREVEVSRLLESAGAGTDALYTVSPYVGCLIGCRFCYAQKRVGMVRRLQGLPTAPWGSFVEARINAPQVLARELAELPPRPLKFCPIVSDPYHAVERRYRLTRGCLVALRDAPPLPAVLLLTRSSIIAEDIELIASVPNVHAGVSLPTIDDEVRSHFEPRAASVRQRLTILDQLRDAGASTLAVVQPLLPGPVEPLADALRGRADSVSIDVLRGEESAGPDFDDPRYGDARSASWQREQATALRDALRERGVAVWTGELPPEVGGGS